MRLRQAIIAVTGCLLAACGGTGVTSRPIETSLFITGAQGSEFTLGPCSHCSETVEHGCASSADCPLAETCVQDASQTAGSGITAPNADHQLVIEPTPGVPQPELFAAPQLFVMENIRQPIRAVIQNLDTANTITVGLYLGDTLQNTTTVGPGQCLPVTTVGTAPTPNPSGQEVRIDICSPIAGLAVSCINSELRCAGGTDPNDQFSPCTSDSDCGGGGTCTYPPPPDHFFSFFASLGDIKRSNVTNCVLPGQLANGCQTPTTFFLEQPEEEVDAAISVNGGQNPGGLPNAAVRLELYVNGVFQGFQGGTNPVISKHF